MPRAGTAGAGGADGMGRTGGTGDTASADEDGDGDGGRGGGVDGPATRGSTVVGAPTGPTAGVLAGAPTGTVTGVFARVVAGPTAGVCVGVVGPAAGVCVAVVGPTAGVCVGVVGPTAGVCVGPAAGVLRRVITGTTAVVSVVGPAAGVSVGGAIAGVRVGRTTGRAGVVCGGVSVGGGDSRPPRVPSRIIGADVAVKVGFCQVASRLPKPGSATPAVSRAADRWRGGNAGQAAVRGRTTAGTSGTGSAASPLRVDVDPDAALRKRSRNPMAQPSVPDARDTRAAMRSA
ncbi:hypothetical protein [Streptomyces sp. A012304]|uniref:hypothetical protein n=1 Tax=Streptomyces sp. A012304 TaxID=375446 RepID=UPI00222F6DBD|nr:hypothetical protein [Streptomyces sp. A012304]GKQ38913.1 hypothetical protein ALMP_54420 [Streptomyces sp. A012304]